MALLTRPASSSLALLLLGLLFIICNLKLALASSSGGVMGGSFFHDSDSSSSESFTNDHSEHVMVQHEHDSPASPDDTHEHASQGGGVPILFLIFMFGLFLVGFCRDTNGNAITVLKLQVQ